MIVTWRNSGNLFAAMTSRKASGAERPLAIKSKAFGPIDGSVTFWVDTAPTPACAQGHRLATQMLEVVIATPNIPVVAQRPVREKVMGGPSAPGARAGAPVRCASWRVLRE